VEHDSTRVREMIDGYRLSQAIFVAAELRIADRLAEDWANCEALATVTETDPPSLLRLLRALTSAGLLEEAEEGRFRLTDLGRLLRQKAEGSLHAWASLNASLYLPWGDLLHSVRTGKPAFDHTRGKSRWQHLSDSATDSRTFNEAMAESSERVVRELVSSCGLSRFRTMVDVGGGNGILIRTILQACPSMVGVLFDLPEAIRDARPLAHERCTLVEGSFFDAVPEGGDAYVLSRVLHDWNDDRAAAILSNTRRAMANGATLFVVERLLETDRPRLETALSDLSMMVMNGGRERTLAEFEHLLTAARFNVKRLVPTPTRFQIIETEAV
jgi:DNA-binding transcriptional ArsR family regulator